MTEPANEDERLAALLDGRLTEREREELLAHLAVPGDDYEVFAETAAILREIEEEDAAAEVGASLQDLAGTAPVAPADLPLTAGRPVTPLSPKGGWRRRPAVFRSGDDEDEDGQDVETGAEIPADPSPEPGVIPLRPRRRHWGRRPGALVAAAAAIVVMVVGGLIIPGRGSYAGVAPEVLAGTVSLGDQGLPAGWSYVSGPAGRGDGSGGGDDTQAARTGALLVDLEVAVRSRDSAQTARIARELRLDDIRAQAGADPQQLRPLLDQAGQTLELEQRGPLRFGAWIEAARLAASARDEAFFEHRSTRRPPRAADHMAGGNPALQQALKDVRAQLSADGLRDWPRLGAALDGLLQAATAAQLET